MIEKRKITLHRLSKLDNDDYTNTRFDRSVEDKIFKLILKEMETFSKYSFSYNEIHPIVYTRFN